MFHTNCVWVLLFVSITDILAGKTKTLEKLEKCRIEKLKFLRLEKKNLLVCITFELILLDRLLNPTPKVRLFERLKQLLLGSLQSNP